MNTQTHEHRGPIALPEPLKWLAMTYGATLNQSWQRVSGSWVMGQGSNRSTNLDGSLESWVDACDPLTHDPLTD